MALIDSGDYESAYALLEEIGNNEAIASSKYDIGIGFITGLFIGLVILLKLLH